MAKPALGRGLGALLGGGAPPPKEQQPASAPSKTTPPSSPDHPGDQVRRVPLGQIRPCSFQPRKDFTEETLRELADSIREQGIVQPLVVRPSGDGYELIAGERRWRAAQLLKLKDAPVIVREADDRSVLELALIENLQRENLNPLEEALGFSQLIEHFDLTQEDVATKVGKSRVSVTNALRLLKLPPRVQEQIRRGKLSFGHAKVILGLPLDDQIKAADKVIKDELSVRQTEELVAQLQNKPRPEQKTAPGAATVQRDPHVAAIESKIAEKLGTKVGVRYQQGKGHIEIRFFNDDDLQRLMQLLGVSID